MTLKSKFNHMDLFAQSWGENFTPSPEVKHLTSEYSQRVPWESKHQKARCILLCTLYCCNTVLVSTRLNWKGKCWKHKIKNVFQMNLCVKSSLMIWISDTGVKAREAGVHGNRQKQFFFYQTTPLQTLNSDERFHYAEREKKKSCFTNSVSGKSQQQ